MNNLVLVVLLNSQMVLAAEQYQTLLSQGNRQVVERKFSQAATTYRQVLKKRKHEAGAQAGLGWALFNLGQKQEGLALEQQVIRLTPNNADAHHYLGTMFLASNRIKEAVKEFRISTKLDPKKKCNCGGLESIINFSTAPKSGT